MSSSGWAQTPRTVPSSAASRMRRDASGGAVPRLGAGGADPLADPLRQPLGERLAATLRGDQELHVTLELGVVVAVGAAREMSLHLDRELLQALTVDVALELPLRLPTSHVTHRRVLALWPRRITPSPGLSFPGASATSRSRSAHR